MTLQQIAQILGGIGVIASIIYVGIQIRNKARALRAATYHQVSTISMQGWLGLGHNGETTDIMLRGLDDFSALSRVEKARFRFIFMGYAKGYENAWFQHKIGTLREDDWNAMLSDVRAIFSSPGSQAAWPLVKNRFNAKFVAFLDEIVETQKPVAAAYVPPAPLPAAKPRSRRKPR